jgi:hypothetical protein
LLLLLALGLPLGLAVLAAVAGVTWALEWLLGD